MYMHSFKFTCSCGEIIERNDSEDPAMQSALGYHPVCRGCGRTGVVVMSTDPDVLLNCIANLAHSHPEISGNEGLSYLMNHVESTAEGILNSAVARARREVGYAARKAALIKLAQEKS